MPRFDQDDHRFGERDERWRDQDEQRRFGSGGEQQRSWGGDRAGQARSDERGGQTDDWRWGRSQGHSTYGQNEDYGSARRSQWRDDQRQSSGEGDWGRGGYPQGGQGRSGYGGDFGQEGARQRSLGGSGGLIGANPPLDRAARGEDEREDLGFLPNRAPWARDRDNDRGEHRARGPEHHEHQSRDEHRGLAERLKDLGQRFTDRDHEDHEHEPDYLHWRNQQLSNYDNEYSRWREEQAKKHDEEYRSFRDQRRSQFHSTFSDWRTQQSQQAGQQSGQQQGSQERSGEQNPSGRQSFGGFQSFGAGGSNMSQGMHRNDLEPAGSTTGHQFVGHGTTAEDIGDGRGGYGRGDASALDKGYSNAGSSQGTISAAGPGAGEEQAEGGQQAQSGGSTEGGAMFNPQLSAVSDGKNKADQGKNRDNKDEDTSRH